MEYCLSTDTVCTCVFTGNRLGARSDLEFYKLMVQGFLVELIV